MRGKEYLQYNKGMYYKGAIWTNHVLDRLKERGLSQDKAGEVFLHPEKRFKGKQLDTVEYKKHFGNSLVTLIVKQNEKKEFIVISAWIDPPLPGTKDAKKKEKWLAYKEKYHNASFWGKVYLTFKKQIGL